MEGCPSEPRGTRLKILEAFTPEGRKGMMTLPQTSQVPHLSTLEQWSPASLAPGTGFVEEKFSTDQGVRGGFRMIQLHCIY